MPLRHKGTKKGYLLKMALNESYYNLSDFVTLWLNYQKKPIISCPKMPLKTLGKQSFFNSFATKKNKFRSLLKNRDLLNL